MKLYKFDLLLSLKRYLNVFNIKDYIQGTNSLQLG